MKLLEFVEELRLRRSDFAGIDEDTVAGLALINFAITEANVLMRIYMSMDHDFDQDETIDTLNYIQRNTVLRIWSAKLFEISEFVNLKGKYNRPGSNELNRHLYRFQRSFRWLERHPGFRLVRKLRHEATNHYTLSAARKNLKALPDTSDFSYYVHKLRGNSFYPMGECVMHYGGVIRHSRESQEVSRVSEASEYDYWLHWNLSAMRWLVRIQYHLTHDVVLKNLPNRRSRQKMLWMNEDGAAVPRDRLVPFFVRNPE